MSQSQILKTKITLPSIPNRILIRERVIKLLSKSLEYRLTILNAGAGCGKSISLITLAQVNQPVIWYQIGKDDVDTTIFLHHLFQATRLAYSDFPKFLVTQTNGWDERPRSISFESTLYEYLNSLQDHLPDPALMIFDDAHHILHSDEIVKVINLILEYAPSNLHIIISTRHLAEFPGLSRRHANGEVLQISQEKLAFTSEEITQLFETQYHHFLEEGDAKELFRITEGWPLSFPLLLRSLKDGDIEHITDISIRENNSSINHLFDVLAEEVVNKQPENVRLFLKTVSVLQSITPEICDYLRDADDSNVIIEYLLQQNLFISKMKDGSLRFHNVFHRFLKLLSNHQFQVEMHQKAATYYSGLSDLGETFYHLMKSENHTEAARVLSKYGKGLLDSGRIRLLTGLLDSLPTENLSQYPVLMFYLGELSRLQGKFHKALAWLEKAEECWMAQSDNRGVAQALRGQARVHLDTISPAKAESLLQKALQIGDKDLDPEIQARLYEMLAENTLNGGNPEKALEYRERARTLWNDMPINTQLEDRILLRTGKLQQLRSQLELRAEEEKSLEPIQKSRAHRETQLLLSLLYSFIGKGDLAYKAAQEATDRGEFLNSPYVTIMGIVRQANALVLLDDSGDWSDAHKKFEESLSLALTLDDPKMHITSLWGLSRIHGFKGNFNKAEEFARQCIEIATEAGDLWVASLIKISLVAALVFAEQYKKAETVLQNTIKEFQECGDPFGETAAKYWLSIVLFKLEKYDVLNQVIQQTLAAVHKFDYAFLLTRKTLLGSPNPKIIVPILIYARDNGIEAATATAILEEIRLPNIAIHPGYELRVLSLGNFQVWRGSDPIAPRVWRRESAKQLFQLLLTFYEEGLERDQILEYLFPDFDVEKATRNFKIALSTLFNVLEPVRQKRGESSFISREGNLYRIRPEADIWFDMVEFSSLVKISEADIYGAQDDVIKRLEKCVMLYKGSYLPGTRYEDWATTQADRLSVQFLLTADRLCKIYLDNQEPHKVIDLVLRVLSIDKINEPAYRNLMLAYNQLGNKHQIVEVYQRFVEEYKLAYNISPSEQTTILFESLIKK